MEFHKIREIIRCEKAQLAPAEDLPTMMILIILLFIFITGAAHAYDTYNAKMEMMDKAEAGLNFLDTLKNNILADSSSGDVVKSGLIYIDAVDSNASIRVDTSKNSEKIAGSKKSYFYTADNPFKLGNRTKSIQNYWNRMYLYEIIIKDDADVNNIYIIHGGWTTSFSRDFNPEGEDYKVIFDHLINERLDVVALELPVAIRYGDDFPVESLKGQIRPGKIEVMIW